MHKLRSPDEQCSCIVLAHISRLSNWHCNADRYQNWIKGSTLHSRWSAQGYGSTEIHQGSTTNFWSLFLGSTNARITRYYDIMGYGCSFCSFQLREFENKFKNITKFHDQITKKILVNIPQIVGINKNYIQFHNLYIVSTLNAEPINGK